MTDPDDEALIQEIQPVLELDDQSPAMSKHGTRTSSRRSAAAAEPQAALGLLVSGAVVWAVVYLALVVINAALLIVLRQWEA